MSPTFHGLGHATGSRRRRARSLVLPALAVASAACALGGAAPAQAADGGSGSGAETPRSSGVVRVATVQRRLGVRADGVLGPATRAAILRFQSRRGLAVDGVVGPRTLRALGLPGTRVAGRVIASGRGGSAPSSSGSGGSGSSPSAGAPSPALQQIARCESGGNPGAVSASGQYRGKYQFSRATWQAVGGTGDPAAASEAEQDQRAAALYAQSGTSAWPSCG